MANYLCQTCGAQYSATEKPPTVCTICEDERQYVGFDGQQWTTLADMKSAGYQTVLCELEPSVYAIGTSPSFAIGQRAFLLQTAYGNLLWDCVSFIDENTVDELTLMGGIQAIALSHPHFYTSMVEWSRAFGGAPIYLAEADKQWIIRPDPAIRFWRDAEELFPGVTLIQCGGHFPGSSVLHWTDGAGGQGVLFVADTVKVALDRKHVSFMWSYPNLVPLSATAIEHIVASVRPYDFDRIYGGWRSHDIMTGAKQAVETSAERYLKQIRG